VHQHPVVVFSVGVYMLVRNLGAFA
jgi:hypothetical protein